ncbi:hypothetical protein OsJ_20266 [Oryza sativa Japonica Group]|uniref:Uncharacterized protein n=1 Tax=Oryza sativa subsp. japonica TaxID=39947 RepID=B9FRQ3_ORYSJ|nr:hypothetical protein OsJ_20266 [Oryza sativa Japonica Group]
MEVVFATTGAGGTVCRPSPFPPPLPCFDRFCLRGRIRGGPTAGAAGTDGSREEGALLLGVLGDGVLDFSCYKPKPRAKKERTEEEKKFRRKAKYFLATQLVAVLLFLSLMGGADSSELDDEDGVDYED